MKAPTLRSLLRRLALLLPLALVAPVFAVGPGLLETTEDVTSAAWRVSGGAYSWIVAGTLDGATVTLEGSAGGGWAAVTGSALTAPGVVTLWMSTLDARIVVAGSGASTDLSATLRRIPVNAAVVEVGGGSGTCEADGTGCPDVEELSSLCAEGEGVLVDGAGALACVELCQFTGQGCSPIAYDDLSDMNLAGIPVGGAAVFGGLGYVASAEPVCLADGTNCPAAGQPTLADNAIALAASAVAADWLSVATSILTIDTNADGAAELVIDRSGDRAQILSPSGSNLVLGGVGGSSVIIRTAAADRYLLNDNGLYANGGDGFVLKPAAGSEALPNLVPYRNDEDTGFRADGSNTAFVSCGAETCMSWDNDGTNHLATVPLDTGQATAGFRVQTSAAAMRFEVGVDGPRVPSYTVVPACGAGQAGVLVLDSDATPPSGCLCNGADWITIGTAVDACNES